MIDDRLQKKDSKNVTWGILIAMTVIVANLLTPMFLVVAIREHPVVEFLFNGPQIFVYWAITTYAFEKFFDYLSERDWYKGSFLVSEI